MYQNSDRTSANLSVFLVEMMSRQCVQCVLDEQLKLVCCELVNTAANLGHVKLDNNQLNTDNDQEPGTSSQQENVSHSHEAIAICVAKNRC